MKSNELSQNVKTIVAKLNQDIRRNEAEFDYEHLRFLLVLWAENYARTMFGTTLEALDPDLAALLWRICEARGHLVGDDAFQLVDYGIAALDLRAPEDR